MASGKGTQTPWVNADGLVVKFGAEEGGSQDDAGSYTHGEHQVAWAVIDAADLTATETIVSHSVRIPKNAYIEHVRVTTLIALATGTAVDVGLVYYNGTTLTELDYNGLLAANITASMNTVGEMQDYYKDAAAATVHDVLDGTGTPLTTGGALIGTSVATTAPEYYISASRTDATAFTAGQFKLEVFYIPEGITLYA
jgi:hypothetical protein